MAKYNLTINCTIDIKQVIKEGENEDELEELQSQEMCPDSQNTD